MLVECGQHWTRAGIDLAVANCLHFLHACALLAEVRAVHLPDRPPQPATLIEP